MTGGGALGKPPSVWLERVRAWSVRGGGVGAGPCGAVVGWVLVRALSNRWPLTVGAGISVAVATVVGGMLLRVLTGQGTAPAFVAVATVAVAVLLVGWRAAVAWLTARR